MYFFNLSLFEFLGLLGATSAVVVTLYLLNRSRRKQVVATLHFWKAAEQPVLAKRRKKIQQPWSLLLQLVSIAFLLLALAQLRLGSPDRSSRDHILILDTSSWMSAKGKTGTLLDEAKELAVRYIRALPPTDRVMLVRADGLAAPATTLGADRTKLERAVMESRPGAAGLNLHQALQFAAQAQKLHAIRAGEVVFAGAGRVSKDEAAMTTVPDVSLRVLPVASTMANIGLRRLSLRRSLADPDTWEVFVAAHNYSEAPQNAPLVLTFGGAVVAGGRLTLPPGKDEEATFQFRTKAAGWLEARLMLKDALEEDDRVFVELPALKPLRVAVYTDDPGSLRPILDSNRQVEASYLNPGSYGAAFAKGTEPTIYVFDRFVPEALPKAGAILIQPPSNGSPFRVVSTATDAGITRWHSEHALGAGLRTKESKLDSVEVFTAREGDIAVAEVNAGPVILARPGTYRLAAIGFHPGRSSLRFDLATPLMFANLLRWMEPDVFRRWELNAGSVGAVNAAIDAETNPEGVRVIAENNTELPFTVSGKSLRFYSGVPGTVRVISDNREQVYSLTLPEVGDELWNPPARAQRGIPAKSLGAYSRDIWQWLAALGAIGLALEWLLYGRLRQTLIRAPKPGEHGALRRAS